MASGNKTQVLGLKLSKKGGELIQKLTASNELLELLEVESSLEEFERRAMSVRPGLMVIEYRSNLPALVDLLERLRVQLPSSPVVALSKGKDPDEIIQAMRLGVREFLVIGPELLASFSEAVLRLKQPTAADEPTGRIIGIMGAKGGVGTSSIAVNLAWGLSQVHAQRVALVDLDLYGGNQAFLLDMEPETGLFRRGPGVRPHGPGTPGQLHGGSGAGVAHAGRARRSQRGRGNHFSEHVLTVLGRVGQDPRLCASATWATGLEESTLAAMDRAEQILLGFGAHPGGVQGRPAHLHLEPAPGP
jgi:hypothetical protein